MKAAGFSSLAEDSKIKKAATVKFLLEHGADVNTTNDWGKVLTIIFI